MTVGNVSTDVGRLNIVFVHQNLRNTVITTVRSLVTSRRRHHPGVLRGDVVRSCASFCAVHPAIGPVTSQVRPFVAAVTVAAGLAHRDF